MAQFGDQSREPTDLTHGALQRFAGRPFTRLCVSTMAMVLFYIILIGADQPIEGKSDVFGLRHLLAPIIL